MAIQIQKLIGVFIVFVWLTFQIYSINKLMFDSKQFLETNHKDLLSYFAFSIQLLLSSFVWDMVKKLYVSDVDWKKLISLFLDIIKSVVPVLICLAAVANGGIVAWLKLVSLFGLIYSIYMFSKAYSNFLKLFGESIK